MSKYIKNIINRHSGVVNLVKPMPRSRFEKKYPSTAQSIIPIQKTDPSDHDGIIPENPNVAAEPELPKHTNVYKPGEFRSETKQQPEPSTKQMNLQQENSTENEPMRLIKREKAAEEDNNRPVHVPEKNSESIQHKHGLKEINPVKEKKLIKQNPGNAIHIIRKTNSIKKDNPSELNRIEQSAAPHMQKIKNAAPEETDKLSSSGSNQLLPSSNYSATINSTTLKQSELSNKLPDKTDYSGLELQSHKNNPIKESTLKVTTKIDNKHSETEINQSIKRLSAEVVNTTKQNNYSPATIHKETILNPKQEIQVHIGQIIVNAITPEKKVKPKRTETVKPKVSLSEYLQSKQEIK